TVDVVDSVVTGNTGAREGGGLWNSAAGVLTVSSTEITGNTTNGALADQGGGGVFTEGGDVLVDTSLIADNAATGAAASGGGILNITGSVTVVDSEISSNTAVRAGGGIEAGPLLAVPDATPSITGRADATETALVGVDLLDNTVTGPPGNGGGIHLTGAGDVLVDTSLVSGNSAVEGGGLWNSAAGTLAVTDTTLEGNTATGTDGGGALYQDGTATTGGTLIGINVTVTGNTAAAGRGGALLNAGNVVAGLLHATVVGNSSGVAGTVEIGNTILTANDADDTDAGVTSVGGNVLDAAVPFSADRLAGADDTTGVTDPQLGALADNGGPTPTLLPRTGSPVIDAGLPVADAAVEGMDDAARLVDFDQRGVARPLDGNGDGRADLDSGSVEAAAIAVTPAPGGGGVTPPARPVPAQPNYTG
ncbi:MAG: putative extracellular nuclease, partial [Klenkia sp.]|nr:putative extracellular nuclease [Klenkia sp.]